MLITIKKLDTFCVRYNLIVHPTLAFYIPRILAKNNAIIVTDASDLKLSNWGKRIVNMEWFFKKAYPQVYVSGNKNL